MAFFPDVKRGDAFRPNALLSNNVRHIVNSMNGFQGGRQIGAASGIVKVQVYCASALEAGTAVNFAEVGNFCGDAIPCVSLTDPAKPWGVVVRKLAANEIGSCIISGPATVSISGDNGSYAQPDTANPAVFQREATGAQILFVSDDKAVINLGGSSGGGTAEYNGYFKLVDASENTDGVVTHKIKIVDGATYNGESSFDSLCKVNNVTFYIPAYTSDAIAEKLYFYLKYTAATETGSAKVEIISYSTSQSDTISNSYYQLGRVFLNDGNMTIQQDHVTGVPQIFFYGVCS